LVRVDPHIVLERTVIPWRTAVPFQAGGDGRQDRSRAERVRDRDRRRHHLSPTTSPRFHRVSEIDGVDMVTVRDRKASSVTAAVKVKIEHRPYLGPETATVRAQGEAIGHVTTSEYGSQMLSLAAFII